MLISLLSGSAALLGQAASRYYLRPEPIRLHAGQIRVPAQLSFREQILVADLKAGQRYQLSLGILDTGRYTIEFAGAQPGRRVTRNSLSWIPQASFESIQVRISLAPGQTRMAYLSVEEITDRPIQPAPRAGAMLTNSGIDLEEMVRDHFIKSSCVEVSNIQFRGGDQQRGVFSNGMSSIGFEEGMMLATGSIDIARGPNNFDNASLQDPSAISGEDFDLLQLFPANQYNLAVLEFDFVPEQSSVQFDYVFASEEYCEYVGSDFNDIFGFFLRGPGISGPFSGGINIARIPSTGDYVAINNVNQNVNASYYVGNRAPGQSASSTVCISDAALPAGSPSLENCQFDGFTVPLRAIATVIPCETYHIKLAIADLADQSFDSGVFFKLNSFNAGDGVKAEVVYEDSSPDAAIEACSDIYFILSKPATQEGLDYTVNLSTNSASTATAGIDYQSFPMSWLIPASKDTIHVHIKTLGDLQLEGIETIVLNMQNACACESDEVLIKIADRIPLSLQLNADTLCPGAENLLEPIVGGGMPEITYLWSDGSTGPVLSVYPLAGDIFSVTVTDRCNQSKSDTVRIEVLEPVTAHLTGDTVFCSAAGANMTIHFEGLGPWRVALQKDDDFSYWIETSQNPYTFQVTSAGVYTLKSLRSASTFCDGTVSGAVEVQASEPFTLSAEVESYACQGKGGSVQVEASGLTGPYQFDWSGGLGSAEELSDLEAGTYTLTVTDAGGCSNTLSVTISALDSLQTSFLSGDEDCISRGFISLLPQGGSPSYQYTWSHLPATGDSIQHDLAAGAYRVTVTDARGCTDTLSIQLGADTLRPLVLSGLDTLNCLDRILTIQGAPLPQANVDYQWMTNTGHILGAEDSLLIQLDQGGLYQMIAIDTLNHCRDTARFDIQADQVQPQAQAGLPDTLTCVKTHISLQGSAAEDPQDLDILWQTIDGHVISGAGTFTPLIDRPGTYSLILTDTLNHCRDTATVEIAENTQAPDIAIAAADSITCTRDSIWLLGTSSFTSVQFEWEAISGHLYSDIHAPEVLVLEAGIYLLHIRNLKNGCTASDTVEVFQQADVPKAVAALPDTLSCTLDQVQLSGLGSSTGADFTYLWTTSDGNILSGENSLSPLVDQAGTYHLLVRNITNDCQAMISVEVLEDRDLPIADAGLSDTLTCAIDQLQLSGQNSSSGPQFDYVWTTSGGHILSGQNTLQPWVDQPGTYQLQVTNIDNQCSSSATVQIVEDRDAPIADAGLPVAFNCFEAQAQLDGSGSSAGAGFTYSWTALTGGGISDPAAPDPHVEAEGSYQLVVLNLHNGCTDTATTEVFKDLPLAVTEVLSPQCPGETGSIQILSVEGGTAPYQRSINGGLFSASLDTSGLAAGEYRLLLRDALGCEFLDTVEILPGIDTAQLVLEGIDTIRFGEEILLQPLLNVTPDYLHTIEWTPGTGLSCTDCLHPLAKPASSITYMLTLTTHNGCQLDGSFSIHVIKPRPQVFVPTVFTPNGDGENDWITVFADPDNVLVVRQFLIFDRWGELVFRNTDFAPNEPGAGWNGQFKGKPLDPAVFVWYLEAEALDGTLIQAQGDFTLVR